MLLAVSLLSKVWLRACHSARLPSTTGRMPARGAIDDLQLIGLTVAVRVEDVAAAEDVVFIAGGRALAG